MNSSITYSVVVPVYNSEQTLAELCNRIAATLSPFSFEIILVDDGSGDNSWQVMEQLKVQYKTQIQAISLQKNYGQHAALFCAFSFCHGAFIITIDDDLQYNPEDILLLIHKQEETNAEVVYGTVSRKQHSMIKNMGSYYVKRTSRLHGSSFRLIKRNLIDTILDKHRYNFIFIDEVLQWYTPFFAFVEVSHLPRPAGKSGYSLARLIKLYFNVTTNYTATPLRLMIYFGGVASFLSFFIGLVFILRKLIFSVPLGYTSIIVAILFSTGIMTFCMGIMGLYLIKLYLSQQNKPLYIVKQIIK